MEETITWLFIGVVVVFIVTIACGFYVAYSICRQKRECVGEKKEKQYHYYRKYYISHFLFFLSVFL